MLCLALQCSETSQKRAWRVSADTEKKSSGRNHEKPILNRIHPIEFAKTISKRSQSRKECHGLLFKTVNYEVRVFREFCLAFKHISWLESLCSSPGHCRQFQYLQHSS